MLSNSKHSNTIITKSFCFCSPPVHASQSSRRYLSKNGKRSVATVLDSLADSYTFRIKAPRLDLKGQADLSPDCLLAHLLMLHAPPHWPSRFSHTQSPHHSPCTNAFLFLEHRIGTWLTLYYPLGPISNVREILFNHHMVLGSFRHGIQH